MRPTRLGFIINRFQIDTFIFNESVKNLDMAVMSSNSPFISITQPIQRGSLIIHVTPDILMVSEIQIKLYALSENLVICISTNENEQPHYHPI